MKSAVFFFVFCIFLHENKTKSHDFNRFRKVKERATIIVSWEILPKKEGAYPKRETDTDRLQKTTKVGLRLQSLMIDYKWLEKSDLDYKVYWYDYRWLEKLDLDYKVYW